MFVVLKEAMTAKLAKMPAQQSEERTQLRVRYVRSWIENRLITSGNYKQSKQQFLGNGVRVFCGRDIQCYLLQLDWS